MPAIPEIKKIAFLGDYLPRKCGIATFTYDLRKAMAEEFPETESFVAPVNDLPEGYEYPVKCVSNLAKTTSIRTGARPTT